MTLSGGRMVNLFQWPSNMNEISEAEIKNICLDILCQFDSFCRQNNLKYSLAYGSLIGAIRHGGFIPWDDDIDVIMDRNQYERLISHKTIGNDKYSIICHENTPSYLYPYAKVFRNDTVLLESGKKNNYHLGVNIDVFPIDIAGESLEKAIKLKSKCKKMEKYLVVSMEKGSNSKRDIKSIKHSVVRLLPGSIYYNILDRLCKRNKYKSKGILANLVWGYGPEKEVGAVETMEEYDNVSFEGRSFPAVKNYHHFLEHIYGDYMQLPPVEKRHSLHDFKAFYM